MNVISARPAPAGPSCACARSTTPNDASTNPRAIKRFINESSCVAVVQERCHGVLRQKRATGFSPRRNIGAPPKRRQARHVTRMSSARCFLGFPSIGAHRECGKEIAFHVGMMKRMLLMLAVMTVIIAGLGFVKFQQIQTAIAQGASFQPPPEAVTTIVAQQVEWPETLNAIGSVAAVQGVTVSADLSGTVDRVAFESGRAVRQGEVLVELDTRQERAQLAAAEAQRDLARTNFDRMQGLLKDNVISRAEYDSATADDKQTEARVGEIRAAIQRKRITAPFSGILGIRQVNLGQYLSSGDPIVQLQSLNPIYVNFDVPQQATSQMRIGRDVRITTGDVAGAEVE